MHRSMCALELEVLKTKQAEREGVGGEKRKRSEGIPLEFREGPTGIAGG